jgi:tellurium resistance protein TerD
MAVTLSKGGNMSLSKTDPALQRVMVGLGWEARSTTGADFDLDASAFLVQANGRVRSDDDFIFYNQLQSSCGSVQHTGDNRTGAGDGDDESLELALGQIPASIEKVVFCVTIHDADSRRQNFGQVSEAFMRLVNLDTGVELARFDLGEDYSTETAMIFGEIYRHQGDWKFRAVGQGFAGGLAALCGQFGVQVA